MKEIKVSLNTITNVKKFVNMVSMYDCDIDLVTERYIVDAKSIMGIFSLDLSKPMTLRIHSDECDNIIADLKEFEA
ncbi:MAG: HPr family phosphocarrier protein [Ruminococcaceae bacterium]|nr:HPr family phosphocarrier protein [Oscillospiraceae bacterium]